MEQLTEREEQQFKKVNGQPAIDLEEPSLGNTSEWLGLALQSANMSAYKWDLQTNIVVKSNQSAMASIASPASQSWIYQDGVEYIHQDDRGLFDQKIRRAVETHQDFNIEYRVSIQNGQEGQNDKIRWLQTKGHAVYGDDGKALHILAVTQDITKRKEDEISLQSQKRELELTRNQLKLTLEAAGMVALPNRRSNGKFKSSEMCRFLGIKDENTELDRELLSSLIHPDDRQHVWDIVEQASSHGGPIEAEYRVPLPNGEFRWIMIKGAHIMDDQGGARYIILQDITQRKKTEEQIKQKNHDLSRANEKLERFSGIVAHDLKNPLTSISLSAEILKKAKSMAEVAKKAEVIRSVANRMAQLIEEILQFAKSNSDAPLKMEKVSLNTLLEIVKDNLTAAISESHAQIKVNQKLPEVSGSPSQLLQLFQNLISNALKFRSQRFPEVNISVQDQGDKYIVSIKDNGVGFDPSLSQKLFEPFERFHSDVEGTGLGLSICKRIVERHGGKIWAHSKVGAGSEFLFTLSK